MSVRPHPTKSKKQPGKWWIIDIGRDKTRQQIPFKGTLAEAQKAERNIRQESPDTIPTVTPKIKEMIVPFKKWYKNEVSPKTIRDIDFSIDLYFIPYFGNLRPNQLSIQIFNDFKQDLLDKGLTPTTINKHLNYFSSIIKWAVAHDHCKPLSFVIPRFPRKKNKIKTETSVIGKRS